MVLGARQMAKNTSSSSSVDLSDDDVPVLNGFGYDDAAQRVYGTSYAEWKKMHQKPATTEQLKKYEASAAIHSVHDESVLRTVAEVANLPGAGDGDTAAAAAAGPSSEEKKPAVLSNVCCEDVEEVAAAAAEASARDGGTHDDSKNFAQLTKQKSLLPASHPFATPPPIPRAILVRTTPLKIAVLAASDRASRGEYPDGDLSIPAVERQVQLALGEFACLHPLMTKALVPDEADQIRAHLVRWTESDGPDAVDLVLTTGAFGRVRLRSTSGLLVRCPRRSIAYEAFGFGSNTVYLFTFVYAFRWHRIRASGCDAGGHQGCAGHGAYLVDAHGAPGDRHQRQAAAGDAQPRHGRDQEQYRGGQPSGQPPEHRGDHARIVPAIVARARGRAGMVSNEKGSS
jgi:Protein of unknown function (DUF1244)